MAKNYMEQIAEMLGVEPGEVFELADSVSGEKICGTYAIDKDGFWQVDTEDNTCTCILSMVLKGSLLVKKMPRKPQSGEVYYIPSIETGTAYAFKEYWNDTYNDGQRYNAGMVCETADEAKEKAEKMLAVLREEHEE